MASVIGEWDVGGRKRRDAKIDPQTFRRYVEHKRRAHNQDKHRIDQFLRE
jgi:hypothetical protein